MPSYKLTLAYDGSEFVGWQRQAQGLSIQGLLEDALSPLEGNPVCVTGAGRTDAGVHALGQTASVTLQHSTDPRTVMRAANARLPASIRVLDARLVGATFNARSDARWKTYRYRIWNGEVLSPFERGRVWHVPSPVLDVEAMAAAARSFVGLQDFTAFRSAGSDARTSTRAISSSSVRRRLGGQLVLFQIVGTGFLRHMVRSMAGTLVEIGRGRHSAAWVRDVLTSRDRALAGPTAPPEGLFLVSVEYE